MARPLRIQFPGAVYHVMQRGFRRERVFENDETKRDYLDCLLRCCQRFQVHLYSYCLMDNHLHLLICTQRANLSRFMHAVNSTFANSRQRYRSLDGAIFAGRYKALLVDEDAWLLQVSLYIHLNPVRARMVKNPAMYLWSSCKRFTTLNFPKKKFQLITPEPVLLLLGTSPEEQISRYRELLKQNSDCELPPVHKSLGYGESGTTDTIDRFLEENELQNNTEFTHLNQSSDSLTTEQIISSVLEIAESTFEELQERKREHLPRLLVSYALHNLTSLTLKEIAHELHMNYHQVSYSSSRFEHKMKTERKYLTLWNKLLKNLTP